MNRPLSILDPHFFVVPAELAGERIDKILSQLFPHFSRSYFQYLIDSELVKINDEPVKKRVIPKEGDEVEVYFEPVPELSLAPEPMAFEILFEDEYFLAINKPPGLVVHPAPGHWTGTFVHGLLAHCQNLSTCDDPLRPGIVHRLDKETSGVLLAAKTREAHQKIVELFSSRNIEKLYLAICLGKPPNTTLEAPIGRHPVHRKEMAVVPNGKEAISQVQVIAFNHQNSLVAVRPKTGRTHQIRVHLKHLGAPILGDSVYGKSKADTRLMLHAYRLSFVHPFTKKNIQLSAPIPEDMKEWVKNLSNVAVDSSF